ncbi:hypothetical protein BC937DRAFT_89692 [Endogone sp. FLAS-F59071]|nr:hypothetical protein BC937DRAFT_89692 [Endogone sp. FLAS-F59071]|eukprot:RUS17636.1 hypothetical protein BC937DRAFT_89692 [Endogone sp. FLAS-F59071]
MDSCQQDEIRENLFQTTQIPYLAMIDASVLALQSHGLKTGILVSVGGMSTYVAAVVEGAVLNAPVKKFEIIPDLGEDNPYGENSSMPPATELDECTVLERYFSAVSPDPSVNSVNLVHLIDQCLQEAAVPEDTEAALRKHVVVSGGHAYAVVPILRSKLGPGEYKVHGPSNPEAGQFDVVRGAEHLLTMPQSKETIRSLFTSIDDYEVSMDNFSSKIPPAFYKKAVNDEDDS